MSLLAPSYFKKLRREAEDRRYAEICREAAADGVCMGSFGSSRNPDCQSSFDPATNLRPDGTTSAFCPACRKARAEYLRKKSVEWAKQDAGRNYYLKFCQPLEITA